MRLQKTWKKFFIWTLLIIILLSVAMLTVFYFSTAKHEADRLEVVKVFVRDQKLDFIRNVANNVVTEISTQRRLAEEGARRDLQHTESMLKTDNPAEYAIDSRVMTLLRMIGAIHPNMSALAYNRNTGYIFGVPGGPKPEAMGFTGSRYDFEDVFADYALSEIFELGDIYLIGCGIAKETIYNGVQRSMQEYVDSRVLLGDEYIHVDAINSYSGEGDFARRLITPFYQRRGDAVINAANADYYVGFEQLIRNGESFTELMSGEQLERLIYARLYRPYDWVVSVSISAEDIQYFTDLQMERFSARQGNILAIMALLCLLSTGTALTAFIWIGRSFFRRTDTEFKTIDSLTKRDALTECLNRRGLTEFIEACFTDFLQNEKPSSIIFGDVDKFKLVNDNYGHEYGDAVLRFVARTIRDVVTDDDMVCRWGGEEFLVLMRGKDLNTCRRFAENIRSTIEQTSEASNDKGLRVTISLGLSSFRKDDAEWMMAAKRADDAMYLSKKEGRNRITVDGT